ncbi:MAG: DMT family transporter [Terriglobales bacterium]
MKKRDVIWKTAVVSLVVVGTNVIGNYALKRGFDQVGVVESWSPLPYIRAFSHPWVAAGVVCMLAWLLSRLVLLSWADLSYVIPVTAFSFVLSAIAGAVYLHEKVDRTQWAGICAITIGTVIVALTYPDTTDPEPEE